MGSTTKAILLVTIAAALLVAIGCKSEGSSYRERQRTQGAEVEAMEEHGNTAIDAADETEE